MSFKRGKGIDRDKWEIGGEKSECITMGEFPSIFNCNRLRSSSFCLLNTYKNGVY